MPTFMLVYYQPVLESTIYHHLLNIWFVYFVWGLSPLKRRVVRWRNFARVYACRPCAGHVLGFMSIGVVVTK